MATKLQESQREFFKDSGTLARAQTIMYDLIRRHRIPHGNQVNIVLVELSIVIKSKWELAKDTYPTVKKPKESSKL